MNLVPHIEDAVPKQIMVKGSDPESELAAAVRESNERMVPLEIVGGGTRLGLGRPVQAEGVLPISKLSGLTHYEPAALTIVARAGTPLEDVEATLESENQRLAFEPMDHRVLLGSTGVPTIGAVVACNASGPRRIANGACRDSLLGVRFISGTGDVLRNGGRVMKNVTGYDLSKLLCGSFGTLGVLTEVALKVLPSQEASVTYVVRRLGLGGAVAAMSSALGLPLEISGAAHIPGNIADSMTLFRLEGTETQVAYRLSRLRSALNCDGNSEVVSDDLQAKIWKEVRDAEMFGESDSAVWRVSIKPSDASAFATQLSSLVDAEYLFDLGGGLIWVSVPALGDACAGTIRGVISRLGGHATLVRAPAAIRAAVGAFHPQCEAQERISRALRAKFDPGGILNPGRIAA